MRRDYWKASKRNRARGDQTEEQDVRKLNEGEQRVLDRIRECAPAYVDIGSEDFGAGHVAQLELLGLIEVKEIMRRPYARIVNNDTP